MKQLYFDVGISHLLFVRYNPDSYKSDEPNFNNKKRHEYLIKYLNKQIEKEEFKSLSVIYLFYDGFVINQKLEDIDPYS